MLHAMIKLFALFALLATLSSGCLFPTYDAGAGSGSAQMGQFVYVANSSTSGPGTVAEYAIGFDGALMSIGAIDAGTGASAIVADAATRSVVVADQTNSTVQSYAIADDGTLTAASGPIAVDTAPDDLEIENGQLYVVSQDEIARFALGGGGTLNPIGDPVPVADPVGIAFANPRLAFVTSGFDHSTQAFAVGSDGALTAGPTLQRNSATFIPCRSTAIGNRLFVVGSTGRCDGDDGSLEPPTESIEQDSIDLNTGDLTPGGTVPVGTVTTLVGNSIGLYTTEMGDFDDQDGVRTFSLSGGTLTQLGFAESGGEFPQGLAFAPTGPFAYVGDVADGSVVVELVPQTSGVLAPVATFPIDADDAMGGTPRALTTVAITPRQAH